MSVKLCLYYLNRHVPINGIGVVGRMEQLCITAKLCRFGYSARHSTLNMSVPIGRIVLTGSSVGELATLYADGKAILASDSRIVLGQELVPVNKEQIALSFAPLVRKATPAVVNIYTKKI